MVEIPDAPGAAGAWQALLRLRNTATVLDVIAHPDDEDAGALAYLSRKNGAPVVQLSLTRGEGGANLIRPFFFDQLGVLRTLEFLAASRAYGTELYFTSAADYGYSKTLDEALETWDGAERLLEDIVYRIRRERPTIIISRFHGDSRDGHGHHQLCGVLARKAFVDAGDPKRFPEQIRQGLRPWKARKLYTGNINPRWRPADKDSWTVQIERGEHDPVTGKSYYQMGRFGYGFHRSQGMTSQEGSTGSHPTYYRIAAANPEGYEPEREASMFDGLDTSLVGLVRDWNGAPPADLASQLERLQKLVEVAAERFDFRDPSTCVPSLVTGLEVCRRLLTLEGIGEGGEQVRFVLERKARELEVAIFRALGVDFQVLAQRGPRSSSRSSSFHRATPGQELTVAIRLTSLSSIPIQVKSAVASVPNGWGREVVSTRGTAPLELHGVFEQLSKVSVATSASPTRPPWRRESLHEPFYEVDRPDLVGAPLPTPPLNGSVTVDVLGTEITWTKPVVTTIRSIEEGTLHPTLVVAPVVSVRFVSHRGVLRRGSSEYPLSVVVQNCVDGPRDGSLRLRLPAGWQSSPASHDFAFDRENETKTFDFVVSPAADRTGDEWKISAIAKCGEHEVSEGFVEISAPDVGRCDWYRPATHSVRGVDIDLPKDLRVAYVMGSGDEIPAALSFLGIRPEMLDAVDLATRSLAEFDVVLVGVRAYAVRDDLRKYNARVLDYVKAGGVCVVQYQTPEFDKNFGPYPYSMGRRPEEVSEERAKVTILEPEHVVFTKPNRITVADFDGWVEQRGSKFWASWDDRYVPLLSCHDRRQKPQSGGMLFTRYGKGAYLYSAYAWYRQLPEGVPGAFRIYANLLSLGRTLREDRTER